MTGMKVAQTLERANHERGSLPESTVDNGSEFCGRALRPGHPLENGFIESCHGRLRAEGLNVECFAWLDEAREKLARFGEIAMVGARTARWQMVCDRKWERFKIRLESLQRGNFLGSIVRLQCRAVQTTSLDS